ncbi:MAG: hypothetical protein HY334_04235 [Armatimonadetes bacterium]|nr:hypothetical protein [Armatimonadota bacterium]
MRDLIASLHRSGKTIVLATHDMGEAERLCDRVAIIDRGRIVAVDAPGSLTAAATMVAVPGSVPEGAAATLEDVVIALTRRRQG